MLATTFNARSNSLNAIRLALAAAVIGSHSWLIGGYGPEPTIGNVRLGTWGVYGFFAISGYLITRSRQSGRPTVDFYRARFLRIYPGFLVCLVVVAFAFAPASALIDPSGSFSIPSAFTYVFRNLTLSPPGLGQYGIDGTLTTVPFSGVWNGPLWTLFYEVLCYVLIGVLASILRGRSLTIAVSVLFVLASTVSFLTYSRAIPAPDLLIGSLPLVVAFLAGSLLFLLQAYIPTGPVASILTLAALIWITASGYGAVFAALPFALVLLTLSTLLPLKRVGSKFDISYGMYIYGCPVQQCLVLMFPNSALPVWAFVVLSLAATIPFAVLSCVAVEKPALTLKRAYAQARVR